jgi:hypothetical protein
VCELYSGASSNSPELLWEARWEAAPQRKRTSYAKLSEDDTDDDASDAERATKKAESTFVPFGEVTGARGASVRVTVATSAGLAAELPVWGLRMRADAAWEVRAFRPVEVVVLREGERPLVQARLVDADGRGIPSEERLARATLFATPVLDPALHRAVVVQRDCALDPQQHGQDEPLLMGKREVANFLERVATHEKKLAAQLRRGELEAELADADKVDEMAILPGGSTRRCKLDANELLQDAMYDEWLAEQSESDESFIAEGDTAGGGGGGGGGSDVSDSEDDDSSESSSSGGLSDDDGDGGGSAADDGSDDGRPKLRRPSRRKAAIAGRETIRAEAEKLMQQASGHGGGVVPFVQGSLVGGMDGGGGGGDDDDDDTDYDDGADPTGNGDSGDDGDDDDDHLEMLIGPDGEPLDLLPDLRGYSKKLLERIRRQLGQDWRWVTVDNLCTIDGVLSEKMAKKLHQYIVQAGFAVHIVTDEHHLAAAGRPTVVNPIKGQRRKRERDADGIVKPPKKIKGSKLPPKGTLVRIATGGRLVGAVGRVMGGKCGYVQLEFQNSDANVRLFDIKPIDPAEAAELDVTDISEIKVPPAQFGPDGQPRSKPAKGPAKVGLPKRYKPKVPPNGTKMRIISGGRNVGLVGEVVGGKCGFVQLLLDDTTDGKHINVRLFDLEIADPAQAQAIQQSAPATAIEVTAEVMEMQEQESVPRLTHETHEVAAVHVAEVPLVAPAP